MNETIMKCALFLTLLAFCGLETAFAYGEDDRLLNKLYDLQSNAMQEVNYITNPILAQIQSDVNDAKAKGKNAQPCYESARILMKSYVDPSFSQLKQCRRDAFAAKSLSYAISCNNGVVSTFRQNANTVRPTATSCIASL